MNVLFLQLVHSETDDRIFHQMMTLRQHGHVCYYAHERKVDDGADIIICDTPKAVLKNRGYRGRVIYDVTEWYPSKKNLREYALLLRPLVAVAMVALNLLAACRADAFLFGEKDKARLLRSLFPRKTYAMLPYYPSLRLFEDVMTSNDEHPLRVLYAGPLTAEKGYDRAIQVAKTCGIELTVIGPKDYMPLAEFCRYIQNFDIAFDLRDRDAENRHCLPIKLFYYWAAGVVPIYSDLDAIRRHVPDAERAMYLVRNEDEAIAALQSLWNDWELRLRLRQQGRQFYEDRYHWEMVEERLVSVINQMN